MNYWAQMLHDLPALGQRLVARTQRISLPRNAGADVRLARLRQALCHAATVRTIYAALDPIAQAAVQDLRTWRGGIRYDELERRYGSIRTWRQLAADPHPRTTSERLLLLGWLLPRPATAPHSPHYLLPPELRRWLPTPLHVADLGAAPAPPPPPAVRAAAILLLACAEQPLPLQRDGTPRIASLRALAPRFALPRDTAAHDLCRFVLPLLSDLGLLAPHGGAAVLAPAGQRFLRLSPAQQLARLRLAWIRAPHPDAWLRPLLADVHGMDLPLFRRRLSAWAAALPSGRLLDPRTLYSALIPALGPLTDAQTHGFRSVDRVPWQPRRAAAIWDAAVRGPLTWLGALAWVGGDKEMAERCFATPCARADLTDADAEESRAEHQELEAGGHLRLAGSARQRRDTAHPIDRSPVIHRWSYGVPGEICIPHTALDATVLRLAPYARWSAADADTTFYGITPRTLAAAQRDGHSTDVLWELLTRHAGPPPASWCASLPRAHAAVQIIHTAVILSDHPALLDQAAQSRSVRRYLQARLAPGIALADPDRVPALVRTLARRDLAVEIRGDPTVAPPADLSAAECATLLAALDSYRTHELAGAAPEPIAALEDRLRAALPTSLRNAATMAPYSTNVPDAASHYGALASAPAGVTHAHLAADEPTVLQPPRLPPLRPAVRPADHAARSWLAGAVVLVPVRGAALLLAAWTALWALLAVRLFTRQAVTGHAPQPAEAPLPGDEQGMVCDPIKTTQPPEDHIARLRQGIARREMIQLRYANEAGVCTERIVRPLRLERHEASWYLQAYCMLRRSERTFRVDRIGALVSIGRRPRRGDPLGRRARPVPATTAPKRHPRALAPAPRTGFFPAPPDPPPGSPLVRIWLEE